MHSSRLQLPSIFIQRFRKDSTRRKKKTHPFLLYHYLSLISIPCMSGSGFGRSCWIAPAPDCQINLRDRKSFVEVSTNSQAIPRKEKMKTTAHKKQTRNFPHSIYFLYFTIFSPYFLLFFAFPLESYKEVSNK